MIVITTKRGKAGKPNISFSSKFTFSPKSNIDKLNMLNSNEKVNLELELLRSGYSYREGKGDVSKILTSLGELSTFKASGWNSLSTNAQEQINQLRKY